MIYDIRKHNSNEKCYQTIFIVTRCRVFAPKKSLQKQVILI